MQASLQTLRILTGEGKSDEKPTRSLAIKVEKDEDEERPQRKPLEGFFDGFMPENSEVNGTDQH